MTNKTWHLQRRTLLRGAGTALALPWLDCMTASADIATPSEMPRRFCAIYFPFGVSLPKPNSEQAQWRWFPDAEGREFDFNRSLEVLKPHRENLTIIGGLSHPHGRKMGGHDTGDTFLTGALLNARSLKNTVSVDQHIADQMGSQTRFRSMSLSTDGGVGEPTRSTTLSFDRNGRPVPALNSPLQIFERLFGVGDAHTIAGQRRTKNTSSMLDRVLADSSDLRRQLGSADQRKLDEYLDSVRHTEKEVGRAEQWLEIPKPTLSDQDRETLQLDADDQAPDRYIQVMYDLLYLAFQTDSTRIATYQISSMNGAASKGTKFPQLLNFNGSIHKLAHNWNKPGGAESLGRWDRFLATHFARFLNRLSTAEEGEGSLLDHSMILYGSSNSNTHNNRDYPLILAGGKAMNLRHGRYLRFSEDVPMANLFVTMLERAGVPTKSFADSTGDLAELTRDSSFG